MTKVVRDFCFCDGEKKLCCSSCWVNIIVYLFSNSLSEGILIFQMASDK